MLQLQFSDHSWKKVMRTSADFTDACLCWYLYALLDQKDERNT
jgi:hypothetical protein